MKYTTKGINTMKINLSDIQSLVVGRGRKPYENAELLAEISTVWLADGRLAIKLKTGKNKK